MPEGEFHEIGLLYVHFLLKQKGIGVDYLGTNVPVVDLKFLTEFKKVDFLFSHITSPAKSFKFNKFLDQLGQIDKSIPIVLSGLIIQEYKGNVASNVHLKRSLLETIDFMHSI
jgi:methanogenic corrinoid protein MtbC1